jgi:hypothetical protein
MRNSPYHELPRISADYCNSLYPPTPSHTTMVKFNNKEVGQVGYGLMGSLTLYISPEPFNAT